MKKILTIIGLVAVSVATFLMFDFETVKGHEMGVKETWTGGVIDEPLPPKTYFLFPGFSQKVFTYDMSSQVFVMNDKDYDYGEGRQVDSYTVQSSEGQDMRVSLSLRWRRDSAHIVELHKTVQDNIEERLIRPEIMRIVKDEATVLTALEAYAGEGLVKLQKAIFDRMIDPQNNLAQQGVIVENFAIEGIELDPKYIEQIRARQVAVQARLRAIEETAAAEAEADKAKAVAQADYETQIVQAERDKQIGILNAEREAEQQILEATAEAERVRLAAQAEKDQNILKAEGEKEAGLLRAQAIIALGEANAESQKLLLSAYAVPGAESFVRIQVAEQMSNAFKNVSGYLPESMSVNLLAEQYTKGVNLLVSPTSQQ